MRPVSSFIVLLLYASRPSSHDDMHLSDFATAFQLSLSRAKAQRRVYADVYQWPPHKISQESGAWQRPHERLCKSYHLTCGFPNLAASADRETLSSVRVLPLSFASFFRHGLSLHSSLTSVYPLSPSTAQETGVITTTTQTFEKKTHTLQTHSHPARCQRPQGEGIQTIDQ